MSFSFFGPLFILKYKGLLCPCLETTEERAARHALRLLSNLPILWLRTDGGNDTDDDGHSLGASLLAVGSKLFSSPKRKNGANDGGIPSTLIWTHKDTGSDTYDNDDGSSSVLMTLLQVQPQSNDSTDDNATNDDTNRFLRLRPSAGYMKNILLSDVDDVGIRNSSSSSGRKASPVLVLTTNVGGKRKTLLQFTLRNTDDNDDDDDNNSITPQDVQDAFRILIAWEVNRIPEQQRQEQHEHTMNRAQRAKHFYQREVELQRLKKQREERKAKYLNMSRKNGGGGGMKYTAIAMANRADRDDDEHVIT